MLEATRDFKACNLSQTGTKGSNITREAIFPHFSLLRNAAEVWENCFSTSSPTLPLCLPSACFL